MNIDFTLAGAVIITGLVVVFVALIGLSLIVWLIGKLFVSTGLGSPKKPAQPPRPPSPPHRRHPRRPRSRRRAPAPAPAAPAAPAPASTMVIQPIVEEGIGDDIIAVISAAVASMFGGGESASRGRGRLCPAQHPPRTGAHLLGAGRHDAEHPTFLIDGGQRQCLKFLRTRSRRSCPSRAS